jgi:hypothetical protein
MTYSSSIIFWGRRHEAKLLNPPPPACRGQGVPNEFADSVDSHRFCRLQSLSGDPASAADPIREISLFTPPPHFSRFFSFLFADQKFIKNLTSIKPSQNLKNQPLGAQS